MMEQVWTDVCYNGWKQLYHEQQKCDDDRPFVLDDVVFHGHLCNSLTRYTVSLLLKKYFWGEAKQRVAKEIQ